MHSKNGYNPLLFSNYLSLVKSVSLHFSRDILFAITPGILESILVLLTSMISAYIFSHLHEAGQSGYFIVAAVFAIFMLAASILSYINELSIKSLNTRIIFNLVSDLWCHLTSISVNAVKKINSGDLAQRIFDYEVSISMVIKASLSIIFDLAAMSVLFGYMLWLSGWVAGCYLLICLIFLFIKIYYYPVNLKHLTAQIAEQGKISSLLNEALLQIHKIRSTNIENEIYKQWLAKIINVKIHAEKSVKVEIITGVIESLIPAMLILFMMLAIYFSSNSHDSWLLLQFIIVAGQFSGLVDKLSKDISTIIHLLPGIKRIEIIISERPEIKFDRTINLSLGGDIVFSHIYFKNPQTGNLILNDISFTIPQGKFIAFAGKSGSGKSTLFRLLLGLESPCAGEIRVGGENINVCDASAFRRQCGVVLQTTSLLPGTIFSNISAHDNLTTEEVWELVRCVGLLQEINAMPMKLYTYISDNASESISGGQRQKILLARALAAKPKILLLDEATSALDNQSQAQLQDYLQTLNITRIVIAHRLSTIIHADRIYVLDEGKIIDSGTYKELSSRGVFT